MYRSAGRHRSGRLIRRHVCRASSRLEPSRFETQSNVRFSELPPESGQTKIHPSRSLASASTVWKRTFRGSARGGKRTCWRCTPASINLRLFGLLRLATRENEMPWHLNGRAIAHALAVILMAPSIYGTAQGQPFPGAAIGGAGSDQRPLPPESQRVDPSIDGSRFSSAPAWDNNFCLSWTDGCTTCSRKGVQEPIMCQQNTDGKCSPKGTQCKEVDKAVLHLSCARYSNGVNECTPRFTNGSVVGGLCTVKGIPVGSPIPRDFQCLEDWNFQERWYCSRKTPKSERDSCDTDQIAKAAAERGARPEISFPGLRR